MGMLLPWVRGLLVFFLWFIVFGPLLGCFSWSLGLGHGFRLVFLVLVVGVVLWKLGLLPAIDIEEVLSGVGQGDVHVVVADVIKSFDTVDRGILDRVLSSLGLPGLVSAMLILNFILWLGLGLSFLLGWCSLGLGMVGFLRVVH